MERYHIGDRLQIGDDICTVRYIGYIDVWKDELAFGVEWDDTNRGKHSGTLNGHRYFSTTKENSGSFLKWSKVERVNQRGFLEAVYDIYGTSTVIDQSLRISSKNIEYLGFEELNSRNQEISSLESISLEKKSISCLSTPEEGIRTITNPFKNLKNLNISNNLISNFGDILELLEYMPSLSTLKIGGNKFKPHVPNPGEIKIYNSVKHLSLSGCDITIKCIGYIVAHFPLLESLDLGGNNLSELRNVAFQLPKYVNHLSLFNVGLDELPLGLIDWKLEYLNLSHNKIRSVILLSAKHASRESSLAQLDLSHNAINNWESIDQLNETFLQLKSLRINDNPILSADISETNLLDSNKKMFLNVLARFNNLDVLDGSHLTKVIKEEAELYLLSAILSNSVKLTKDTTRWLYFKDKYGIPEKIDKSLLHVSTEIALLNDLEIFKLYIHYNNEDDHFEINILPNSTIRYMKSIISKHVGVPILQMKVLYEPTSETESMVEISRNFSLVSDLGLTNGSDIYVMLK